MKKTFNLFIAEKRLIVPAFCIFFLSAAGQKELANYTKEKSVEIKSIETDSTDYSDLKVIGDAIGDARIVMLGEQDHGDAPTFLAKTRLIKYLHEKKGFNVLAFESDFFALNYGLNHTSKGKTELENFFRQSIYSIWTFCNTCQNLFYNYIPRSYTTTNPLIISGFDNQLYADYSVKYLLRKLDSILRSLDCPVTHKPGYATDILSTIDSLIKIPTKLDRSADFYPRCRAYLQEIKHEVEQKLNKNNFWALIIDNLIQLDIEEQNLKSDTFASIGARDSQMARNLKWLAKVKFPGEKIIVWAANGHIAKYESAPGKDVRMGKYFTSDTLLKRESYILGFTSYGGRAGRLGWRKFSIRKPKDNSVENWIDKNYRYAFLDFKTFNELFPGFSRPFYLKALNHQTFFKYDWTKVFDGIFYIRDMYPCEPLP